MLPPLKAIPAGALQRHAIAASSRYTYAILSLPSLQALKATSFFPSIQSTLSFCTSSWPNSRSRYSSRNPGIRLRGFHLLNPEDSVCRNLSWGSISNQNHFGRRYLSSHGWQRSHFWGRYGYGWRCSDQYAKTDGRPKEYDITDHALWRVRRRFLTKQNFKMRKMMNANSFGSLLGQRLHSTFRGDEKDKATPSDIWSPKTQDAIEERFANLKKMLDEDPYGVIFGRRLQTKSPEDVSSCDAMNSGAGRHEGTFSTKNARDLNDLGFGRSGSRQKASSRSKNEPPLPDAATKSVSDLTSEELEFDPITMRKVQKKRSHMITNPPEFDTDESFSIPVKPFKSPTPSDFKVSATIPDTNTQMSPQPAPLKPTPLNATSDLSEPRRGWLAQEGFDAEGQEFGQSSTRLSNDTSSHSRKAGVHKIESALDRHIKAMKTSPGQLRADSSSLKYPIKENTEEDIDLLRASDVRASAGLCKRTPRPTAAEKHGRRSILSHDYERRNNQLDRRLEEELARAALENIKTNVVDSAPKSRKDHPVAVGKIRSSSSSMSTDEKLRSESDRHPSETTPLSAHEARTRIEARRAHQIDVDAQKAAIAAIESRDQSDPSKQKDTVDQSQGASESGTANVVDIFASRKPPQESDQRLAKDKVLVDDIRSIYEDRYGTINANHRQPSINTAKISPIETELGNSINPRKGTNETLQQTTKSANAEMRLRDHQSPLHKVDNIPITTQQPANSSDSSWLKPQNHKMGDQSDTHRQLLREVYKTQNLIRDLSRRIAESQFPPSLPTESPSRPSMPGQNPQQPSNSSSLPSVDQGTCNGASEVTSNKQARLHTYSNPALSGFDSGLPSSDGSEAGEVASIPVSYKILAYDSTTQRVTAAKNTFLTSPASEKRPTVAEALSGLTNPAKFLPHFASLQNAGYEIVSGSSNLLIFRKTDVESPLETSTDEDVPEFKDRYSMPTNPIDGTTPQTGNFASPTGFVNYASVLPTPDSEEGTTWQNSPRAPEASDKVGGEENVFSGGWRDSRNDRFGKWATGKDRQRRKRRWRRMKRMIWVGSWGAGCCYIAGVTSEVFRKKEPRKPPAWLERAQ